MVIRHENARDHGEEVGLLNEGELFRDSEASEKQVNAELGRIADENIRRTISELLLEELTEEEATLAPGMTFKVRKSIMKSYFPNVEAEKVTAALWSVLSQAKVIKTVSVRDLKDAADTVKAWVDATQR